MEQMVVVFVGLRLRSRSVFLTLSIPPITSHSNYLFCCPECSVSVHESFLFPVQKKGRPMVAKHFAAEWLIIARWHRPFCNFVHASVSYSFIWCSFFKGHLFRSETEISQFEIKVLEFSVLNGNTSCQIEAGFYMYQYKIHGI